MDEIMQKDIQTLKERRTRRNSSLGNHFAKASPALVRNPFGKASLCAFLKNLSTKLKKASLTAVSYTHLDVYKRQILDSLRESGVSLKEKVQLRQELFYSVRKLDVLQELIEDETVTEIMVNGPDSIFVERKGRLTKWPKSFTDQEKLEDVIQQIVGKCNRIVNESSPIVDARLETGARVNVVIYPVALNLSLIHI